MLRSRQYSNNPVWTIVRLTSRCHTSCLHRSHPFKDGTHDTCPTEAQELTQEEDTALGEIRLQLEVLKLALAIQLQEDGIRRLRESIPVLEAFVSRTPSSLSDFPVIGGMEAPT